MANTTQNTSITTSWNTDVNVIYYEMRKGSLGFNIIANSQNISVGDYIRMDGATPIPGGTYWEARVDNIVIGSRNNKDLEVSVITKGQYEFFEGRILFHRITTPGGQIVDHGNGGWGGVAQGIERAGIYSQSVTSQATNISTTWTT